MATLDYKGSLSRYRRYLTEASERPAVKASLFLIMSLVLLIVLLVFALKPTLVTVFGLVGQIDQQKKILVKLDEKISDIGKSQQMLAIAQPRLALLDQMLPLDPALLQVANDLETQASVSGVQIEGVEFTGVGLGKNKGAMRVEKIDFSMTANGDYKNLKGFVRILENLRRVVEIESVQIDAANAKNPGLILTVKGAVTMYH